MGGSVGSQLPFLSHVGGAWSDGACGISLDAGCATPINLRYAFLFHFRPAGSLRAKDELACRRANQDGVVRLIDCLKLLMCRPTYREESSRKSRKRQSSFGCNGDGDMATAVQLLHDFIRSQSFTEPMAATFLKPMDSVVRLNDEQTRQHLMPLDGFLHA